MCIRDRDNDIKQLIAEQIGAECEETWLVGQDKDCLLYTSVYEKEGAKRKKVMRQTGFPRNEIFTWSEMCIRDSFRIISALLKQ